MDLNRLLRQEQIAIMRRDAAIEPRLLAQYESEIHRLARTLDTHAYPHRHFPDRRQRANAAKLSLMRWDDDGGAIVAKPGKAFANQVRSDKIGT
ncbi:hypothetical protein [Sphingosinicella sp.]|jgi:hypothetical protein|uniref:hypothetical protein n=1 Tax=Sphingosinicella sp. TaxID=1917971 RepID=UPI0017BA5347|nr:hypothetical protein [Sphingosinicella sp.]MBA4758370.1 hypothetical protein [Sphingosinicella sp.]MEA3540414.1 hypothetical protein [Pseudomonadota bacterium]